MAYQLSDIITKVQLRIRDTGYSTSEITNYINDTQNDVFTEHRLPFMQTTQTYQTTVDDSDLTSGTGLPTDFVQAIDLVMTTQGRESVLEYRDFRQMDEFYPAQPQTGTPTAWYQYGTEILLYPTPDAVYDLTLRYHKRPVTLAADADVPEIPKEYEELLVVGAAYRVLQVKDNYDQAAILENKYAELLQKLVVNYSVPQTGTPLVVRINRGYMGKTYF